MPIEEVMEQVTADTGLHPFVLAFDPITINFDKAYGLSVVPVDRLHALDSRKTFWTQTVTLSDSIRAIIRKRPVYILTLAEAIDAGSISDAVYVLSLVERAAFSDSKQMRFILERQDSFSAGDNFLAAFIKHIDDLVTAALDLGITDVVNLHDTAHVDTAKQMALALGHSDNLRVYSQFSDTLVNLVTDLLAADAPMDAVSVYKAYEVIRAVTGYSSVTTSSLVLALLAKQYVTQADTATTLDEVFVDQEFVSSATRLMALYDELQAQTSYSHTLTIMVSDTIRGEAGDSVEALGHYFAQPSDLLSAWVTFRLGEEAATGWVMNTEGDMPLSEYVGYDFNSFCKVGDIYLGARDEGLYLLDGDTDDGKPIEASVRTMMLDFGSPVMKRVQAAYIGYTSNGKLMLKVRAVSDGELKEQWYEAKELQAQAPREQMVRVGRGLRSRYWQFELVNINGSDFELANLELHPVYLNRRV